MALLDHIEVFKEGAKLNFAVHKEVLPVLALNMENQIRVSPLEIADTESKDKLCQAIINLISQGKVREYLFVLEVWLAKVSDNEASKVREWLSDHGTLASYPERTEGVMVVYCNPKKEIVYTAPIVRNRLGSHLGEWVFYEKNSLTEPPTGDTRFDNLFRKALSRNN